MAHDLAGVERGEVIPDSVAPKNDFLFLSTILFDLQYEFGDTNCQGMKT